MKRSMALTLLIVALMALHPLAVLAQNGPEMDTFVTADELLTVSYPTGWAIKEMDPASGLPGIQMGNSEAALDFLSSNEVPADSEGILVVLFPYDFLAQMSPDLLKGTSSDEIVTKMAEAMFGPPESSGVDVSPAEIVDLEIGQDPENVVEAGYLTFSAPDATEGAMVAYENDGVIIWLIAIASPDNYTTDLNETMLAVAGSVEYTGTADDLINALLGGVQAQ